MAYDKKRAEQNYSDVMIDERNRLQENFTADYFQPSLSDLADSRDSAKRFLQDGGLALIIPARERRPVGESLLGNVTQLLPIQYITVVDGGSEACALDAARKYGAGVLPANMILDAVDWDQLLPILSLDKKPYGVAGTNGKGLAVFAGYLAQYAMANYGENRFQPSWICQHDIELAEYEKYRGVEYLLWGVFQQPNAQYVKMAKTGRGNERCMAMRSMLSSIATLPYVASAIRESAEKLFMKLTRDKWMLTGEFMLSWHTAMARPFATGYLEETLIALFADSAIRVANPNPRSDEVNPENKESKMQQEICNFILAVVLGGHRVEEWDIHDIATFNDQVLSHPVRMGWIPEDDGPVVAEVFSQNRIIPSITTLMKEGMINETQLAELVS